MRISLYFNKEETNQLCKVLDCSESEIKRKIKGHILNLSSLDIQDIASVYTVLDEYDVHTLHKLLAIGVSEVRHQKIKKIIDEVDLDEELQKPVKII